MKRRHSFSFLCLGYALENEPTAKFPMFLSVGKQTEKYA